MQECNTEELYRLHRNRLLSLIQSKVSDAQQAEDLLHDSFEKLENCCSNGCQCERPKSYLFRMALNVVFDFFKSSKKQRTKLKEIPKRSEEENPAFSKDDTSCDLIKCLDKFLDESSPENKEAFMLVDVQQIPQVEVAETLGIPLSTLKSRVQRTRKYLKNRLQSCCPDTQNHCI